MAKQISVDSKWRERWSEQTDRNGYLQKERETDRQSARKKYSDGLCFGAVVKVTIFFLVVFFFHSQIPQVIRSLIQCGKVI